MKFLEQSCLEMQCFLIDGYNKAMKISSKGYPDMGVSEAESENGIAWLQGRFLGFSKKQIPRLYAKGSVIPE